MHDPDALPGLPAVEQFKSHAGVPLPPARVAALAFDKLDVEKGMEVRGSGGELRWLKHPWSVLAFQLAGAAGLRALHAEGRDAERETPPAEPLLADLLARPQVDGLGTLVLIDEVLMFARGKVAVDAAWRGRLLDFFQYLCQAVTKVDRCALVASLLASDLDKIDETGKAVGAEIAAIFNRQKEEGVQPVQKEDVAEVLRRRFFTQASIGDPEVFRPHVTAAVANLAAVDDAVRKDRRNVETRFLQAYPFHPDLTDVFYTRWTQLDRFQRTRGILRTFAIALRDAERWDTAPLVGPNVFLPAPGRDGIAEAARELTGIATREAAGSRGQDWAAVLEGELAKARTIQDEQAGLKGRELEQAVCSVFFCSQPIGQKAHTRDLIGLVSTARPGRIELEQALRRWTDLSWFLDENEFGRGAAGGEPMALPKAWRLGNRPNLKQMHDDACMNRVTAEAVEVKLLVEVRATKSLTHAARASGARVHMLPERPRDVEDDGEFHFAILPPAAVSNAGRPSRAARRFVDETTGADRPRVRRNAVVLVAPSADGLEVARRRVRDYLGWDDVQQQLRGQPQDAVREEMLAAWTEEARRRMPEAIRQAWTIVVTVNAQNGVEAFRVTVGSDPLFATIKADRRARIQETAINAEALLPGGPYDLWGDGETSRRVKDLASAFADLPAAAEDAARRGDPGHHRPGRAGRPVRRRPPTSRRVGQDVVADGGRRGDKLGTGPGAAPARGGHAVRSGPGRSGARRTARAVGRRVGHGRRRDRLLRGRADSDGAARGLRGAGRRPGLQACRRRSGHRRRRRAGHPLVAERAGELPGRAASRGRPDRGRRNPGAAGAAAGTAPTGGRRAGRLAFGRDDRAGPLRGTGRPGALPGALDGDAPGHQRRPCVELAGAGAGERRLAVRRGRRGGGDVETAGRVRAEIRLGDRRGLHVFRGPGAGQPAGPRRRAPGNSQDRRRRAAGVPARGDPGQREGRCFRHRRIDQRPAAGHQPRPAPEAVTALRHETRCRRVATG